MPGGRRLLAPETSGFRHSHSPAPPEKHLILLPRIALDYTLSTNCQKVDLCCNCGSGELGGLEEETGVWQKERNHGK